MSENFFSLLKKHLLESNHKLRYRMKYVWHEVCMSENFFSLLKKHLLESNHKLRYRMKICGKPRSRSS